jgi:hypothetical protein
VDLRLVMFVNTVASCLILLLVRLFNLLHQPGAVGQQDHEAGEDADADDDVKDGEDLSGCGQNDRERSGMQAWQPPMQAKRRQVR